MYQQDGKYFCAVLLNVCFSLSLNFGKHLWEINSFNCGFLVLLIHCSEFPFKREQTFMSLYLKCEAGLKNKNMFIYTHVYDT